MESQTGKREPRILIVEDSPTQAQQLSFLLEENGYDTEIASNGREALAAAARRRPTLVVSDVVMPEMDGFALCREIKSRDELRDVPVILLTSLSSPVDIVKGLECGADNFITKPYEKEYLLSHIHHILLNRELRKTRKSEIGLEVVYGNKRYFITSERQQILDLLLSTYEAAVQKNLLLARSQDELRQLNEQLDQKIKERTERLREEIVERRRVEEEIRRLNAELERRVAERTAELEATTLFLDNVLQSSTEYAIVAGDLRGNILNWNEGARRNYGYTAAEAIGKMSLRALYAPEEIASGRLDDLVRTARTLGTAEGVFENARKNGERFVASTAVTLRRDAAGTPVGYLLISKDITQQKMLEDELRRKNEELEEQNRRVQEANRLKSEFLANMSHELRTPLNAIIGFAQLMHDGKVGPVSPQHREYLGDILASGRHLLQLINDVLDLAKVEAGKMEFRPEPIRLLQTFAEVRDILRPLADQKKISVQVEIDPALDSVFADARSLKQILYNYLSNAIKFTPDGGRVEVRARPEGEGCFRVEVEDNGIGIKSNDLDRLFAEFQQLDSGTAKKHAGTGLGLALTRKIVEAQGGSVGARSVFGRGSLFYAILPRTTPPGSTQREPEKRGRTFGQNAPTVLVIEDDDRDLEWITGTLAEAGYAVETAGSGAEGLARSRAKRYDAILLDLLLPDIIGWEVLHAIRAEERNRDVPVIAVTVVAEKELVRGFPLQDYLTKPVTPEQLLNALRRSGVAAGGARKKILVVDDDPSALKIAALALEASGYEVICRGNGAGGLEIAAGGDIDAVILDLLMPEMDGFEFLDRFRRFPGCRDIPVIVWTNKETTREDRQRLRRSAQSLAAKSRGGIDSVVRELRRRVPPGGAPPD
ncbi:MAG TPA: response regulator [candidate division Zixibacteria bacterium]|nr:response regulator [candidate division Zixibacteria bacterium]